MTALFPSLISADLLRLATVIDQLDPYVAGYHVDIMDHHFVPNLTWGPCFANAIAQATKRTTWVHLMVDTPESYLDQLELPAGSIVTVHLEATERMNELMDAICAKKWLASIAISPETDLERLLPYLPTCRHVLVMSVYPGRSGQAFLPRTYERLAQLASYRAEHKSTFCLAVDGGVNRDNIKKLAQAGVDSFALASALFETSDPVQAVKELTALSQNA